MVAAEPIEEIPKLVIVKGFACPRGCSTGSNTFGRFGGLSVAALEHFVVLCWIVAQLRVYKMRMRLNPRPLFRMTGLQGTVFYVRCQYKLSPVNFHSRGKTMMAPSY